MAVREDKFEFPAPSMRQAIEAFTEAAYGERLRFEHAGVSRTGAERQVGGPAP